MNKYLLTAVILLMLIGFSSLIYLSRDEGSIQIQSIILLWTLAGLFYYAHETSGMRKEMVRQNDIQTQPFLLIYFREKNKKLTIRNAGEGIANKIEFNNTIFNFSEGGQIKLKFEIADTNYLLPKEERELLVEGTDENGNKITSKDLIHFLINPNQPAIDSGIQIRARDVSHVPYLFTIKTERTGTYVAEIAKGEGSCDFS